jgi:enoyl-CoA hydratase
VLSGFYKTFLALRKLPIVSIAAINGAAVGGGMGLAAAADIRLASTTARMGYNFVKLGLSPGAPGSVVASCSAAQLVVFGAVQFGGAGAALLCL